MANSPSQRWENGVMVERAIETNRWKVKADAAPADADEETTTKAVSSTQTENKSVKQASKK